MDCRRLVSVDDCILYVPLVNFGLLYDFTAIQNYKGHLYFLCVIYNILRM